MGSGSVPGLVELDRTSLRERAMTVLRAAVSAGRIEPGTRLVETELSAALGIPRGTVREALRQLEHEGQLETGERARLTVRTLTEPEILDMVTVRAALEGLAAAIISARPDRAAPAVRLHAALDTLNAASGLATELVEADLDFHRLLCEMSGNTTLLRTWAGLSGPIRLSIRLAEPDRARTAMAADNHRGMLLAIGTGDPDLARSAVETHLHRSVRDMLGVE